MSRRDFSCPRMFSANGAASKKAWGIAPGIKSPRKQALKARIIELGGGESPVSALPFSLSRILGRCPRLNIECCAFGAEREARKQVTALKNAVGLRCPGGRRFPNLSQRTFRAVARIIVGDW
jgi:hypothetical protein